MLARSEIHAAEPAPGASRAPGGGCDRRRRAVRALRARPQHVRPGLPRTRAFPVPAPLEDTFHRAEAVVDRRGDVGGRRAAPVVARAARAGAGAGRARRPPVSSVRSRSGPCASGSSSTSPPFAEGTCHADRHLLRSGPRPAASRVRPVAASARPSSSSSSARTSAGGGSSSARLSNVTALAGAPRAWARPAAERRSATMPHALHSFRQPHIPAATAGPMDVAELDPLRGPADVSRGRPDM